MNKDKVLPHTITVWGKELTAVGRGKFPYDCQAKAKHPDAMVYKSQDGGWCHEFDTAFAARDVAKDVFEQKSLRYVVQSGGVGKFQLFNTRNHALLGGVGFPSVEEAFAVCDQWNSVPPGASARAQQITVLPSGIHPATRLLSVTADLHDLGHGIHEAITAHDAELLEYREGKYVALANEYIGLAAVGIAAKQELARHERLGKTATVSSDDFALTISTIDGRILVADCTTEEAAQRVATIARIDVQEAAEWVERYSGSESIDGNSFSYPAVGVWKKDGSYEAAEDDHRADIEAELGEIARARP
ncbi:hypothetical protein [Chromobacterium haemolyticum]|uniref:hypothetical protein n=1 Tax=Chromobacterium haemolyticum TaxID=394935 RepID=UPI0024469857|nr:hypothetical protein [Chromobacterium haemolyticum]MDH0342058.1 hypothetical protein [Chromobacterium haemolyticum]